MKKISSKKIILSLIITVLVGGALAFLFINDFGVMKYFKLKKEMKKVQSDINRADYVLDSLKNEIDSLHKSRSKIEKVAREKFDMHGSNEKLLKVIEK
jgi:cell division protein FtsL